MCKFVQVLYNTPHSLFSNLHYIPAIKACYSKYSRYLQDDFANFDDDILSYIEHCFPFFWVVLTYDNRFMGFVSLDNFTGGINYADNSSIYISNEKKVSNILYSAELTTCFDKKAWGDFTRYSAKIFLKKCFDELGLYKIKVQVYPDNFRTAALMKSTGFKYESTLKSETLRNGKPQDIDIYALYRTYYYKTR